MRRWHTRSSVTTASTSARWTTSAPFRRERADVPRTWGRAAENPLAVSISRPPDRRRSRRRHDDAIHDADDPPRVREGGAGRHAERGDGRRDDEVQRGADQGRRAAEGRKKYMQCVVEIAGGTIFLSDMGPGQQPASVAIALGLDNAAAVDALAARVANAGATITFGPQDMFWGDRFAELTDPFGHRWILDAPKA